MLFSDLVPFYSKDSLYGSVVEDCEVVEVVFVRFQYSQPQRRALRGPAKVFKFVYKVYVFIVGQEEVFGEDVVVEDLFCLLEAGGKKHGFRF